MSAPWHGLAWSAPASALASYEGEGAPPASSGVSSGSGGESSASLVSAAASREERPASNTSPVAGALRVSPHPMPTVRHRLAQPRACSRLTSYAPLLQLDGRGPHGGKPEQRASATEARGVIRPLPFRSDDTSYAAMTTEAPILPQVLTCLLR